MKRNFGPLFSLALGLAAAAAWGALPKTGPPKGPPPKVAPAQPHFRGAFVPKARVRPPASYNGPQKARRPHAAHRTLK